MLLPVLFALPLLDPKPILFVPVVLKNPERFINLNAIFHVLLYINLWFFPDSELFYLALLPIFEHLNLWICLYRKIHNNFLNEWHRGKYSFKFLIISHHHYSIFYFLPRTWSINIDKYPHFSHLLPSVHCKRWPYIIF